MYPFYILLGALWFYPIITWVFFFLTRKYTHVRRIVFRISLVVAAITGLSMVVGVCTRFNMINWMLVTVFYFIIIYLCWWTQFVSHKWTNWLGIIPLGIVLVVGYILGSIAALGLAFATYKYELKNELWVNNSLSVKIYKDSHALSDRRSIRFEVYKTLWWMPLLQKKICEKTNYSYIAIRVKEPSAKYNPAREEIYVHDEIRGPGSRDWTQWADTISLRK